MKNVIAGIDGLLNTTVDVQNHQERVDEKTRQAYLRKYQRSDQATPDMLAGLDTAAVDSASKAKSAALDMDASSPKGAN